MAAKRTITARVAIEGDKAFKDSLSSINNELRITESKLKLVASEFDGNANSAAALMAKSEALTEVIGKYNEKISTLKDALQNARNAEEKWKSSIETTRNELSQTTAKLNNLDQSTLKSGQRWNSLSNQLKNARAELKNLQASSADTSEKEAELTEKISKLENELDALSSSTGGAAKETGDLIAKQSSLESELKKQESSLRTASNSASRYEAQVNNTQAKVNKLNGELTRNNQYLEEARNSSDGCATSIDQYGKAVKESTQHSRENADATQKTADAMMALSTVIMTMGLERGLRAISEAFRECVGNAAEFEYSMKTVEAVTGASSDALAALSSQALELAASTIYTADETSKAYVIMARAGWETQDMLSSMPGVMNLASAAGEDLSSMTKTVVDGLVAFGYSSDQAAHFADVLAAASNNADTTVAEMSESMSIAGSTAGAMGYSIEDVSVVLAAMANAGLDASTRATSLVTALTRMSGANETASAAMKELGLDMFDDSEKAVELSQFIGDLREAFSGMTEEQKINNAYQLAGQRGMKGLLAVVNTSTESWNKLTDAVNNSSGAAEKMAEIQLDSFTGQTKLLQSAVEGLEIEVGSQLNPTLGDMAELSTGAVNGIKNLIVEHKAVVPAVTGAAVALGGFTTAMTLGTAAVRIYQAAVSTGLIATMGGIAAPAAFAAGALGLLVTGILATAEGGAIAVNPIVELQSRIEETSAAIEEQTSSHRDYVAASNETYQTNMGLVGTLNSLIQSYDGSASSAAEINHVIEQLNTSVPELNLSFDEQTGTLNLTASEIENLIKKYSKYKELVEAFNNRDALKSQFDDAKQSMEDARIKLEGTKAKLDELNKAIENGEQVDGTIYSNLSHQVDLASAAYDRSKNTVNDAARAYNDACNEVNTLSDEYDGLTDATNSSTDAAGQAATAEERLEQRRIKQAEAAAAEAEKNKEASQKLLEIKTAANHAMASGEDLTDTYQELSKEYENLKGSGNEYLSHLVEEKLRMLEQMGIAQDLGTQYGALSGAAGIALSELSAYLQDNGMTADDWAKAVESSTDDVVNGFERVKTSSDLSLSDIEANLQYNIDAYTNWNANIATLMDAAVVSGSNAAILFVQYMAEMGIGSADQVQAMVDNIGYTMDTLAPLYGDAVRAAVGTGYNELEIGAAAASGATQPVVDAITGTIADADTESAAGTAMEGAVSGIEGKENDVSSSAEAVADSAVSTMEGKNPDFINIGKAYDDNVAEGIARRASAITVAARAAASNASYAFYEVSWWNIGYNISAGVANGIYSGRSLIISAASYAAASAYQTAKSKLKINSPSKVMEDVGYGYDEGFALGIIKNIPMITSASDLAVDASIPDINTSGLVSLSPEISAARRRSQETVSKQNGDSSVYGILATYLPQLLSAANNPMLLDGDVVARRTDEWQGMRKIYNDRGN